MVFSKCRKLFMCDSGKFDAIVYSCNVHAKSCSRVEMCCFVLHPMYISSPSSSHLRSYQRKVVQRTNVAMLLPRPAPCRLRRPLRCVHLHKSFTFDIPLASRFGNLKFHLLFICVVFLVLSPISVLHLCPQCFDAILLQSFVFESFWLDCEES